MVSAERRGRILEQLEHYTEWPMLVLALAIIPLVIAESAVASSNPLYRPLQVADYSLIAIFAAELIVKASIAPDGVRYLRRNWIDTVVVGVLLVSVLPNIAGQTPIVAALIRPVRIFRSASVMRSIRATRLAGFSGKAADLGCTLVGPKGLVNALVIAGVVFLAATAVVYNYEHATAGSDIHTFGDALEWSAGALTTVGSPGTAPKSPEMRAVGIPLGVLGLTIVGVLTANLAAFAVRSRPRANDEPTLSDLLAHLEQMERQIAQLQSGLRADEREYAGDSTARAAARSH